MKVARQKKPKKQSALVIASVEAFLLTHFLLKCYKKEFVFLILKTGLK